MSNEADKVSELELVSLSEGQEKARASRNKAIALCLVALIGVFYAATITRFGSTPEGANLVKLESK